MVPQVVESEKKLNSEEENRGIVGDNFIKPKFTYSFEYKGNETSKWTFDNTLPIKADIQGT